MNNKIFTDKRGFNMKFFQDFVAEAEGFGKVREVFATTNKKGVIRAFHYQSEPKAQQKIVKPINGSFNVRVVDIGNKEVLEYNNWNNESDPILVKKGNMLGYVALEENSIMLYIADEEFDGELNSGVNPMSFKTDWSYDGELVINDRDLNAEVVDF